MRIHYTITYDINKYDQPVTGSMEVPDREEMAKIVFYLSELYDADPSQIKIEKLK